MQLSKSIFLKQLGQHTAKPLSWVVLSNPLSSKIRIAEAYVAFLQGKGAGEGWDIVEEVKAAKNFIYRKQPVVFDVGANKGLWGKYLLELIPTSKIYQFEPSEACQQEIHKLNLPNAVLIPFGVGKEKTEGVLYSPSPTSGVASLYERHDSYLQKHEFCKYEISITTIDQILVDFSIEFVDFIKLDIEGGELDALKGASDSLSNKRIGALSFEFGSGNINSRTFFRDFWELLTEYSFDLYRITPGGRLLKIDDYYEDLEYFRAVSNYVATLKDHPYAL